MLPLILLATDDDGRWHPGIGDPTVMGWVTVGAYLATTYLCFRAFRSCRFGADKLRAINRREAGFQTKLSLFWLGLSALMLALGINKQLDLQTLFTEIARDMAQAQGWYEERHRYQVLFIIGIAVAGAGLGALLAYLYRHVARRIWLALVGICGLVAFIVIRAASFHHVDLLLVAGPVHLNWVLELGGISLVGLSAYRAAPGIGSATA